MAQNINMGVHQVTRTILRPLEIKPRSALSSSAKEGHYYVRDVIIETKGEDESGTNGFSITLFSDDPDALSFKPTEE